MHSSAPSRQRASEAPQKEHQTCSHERHKIETEQRPKYTYFNRCKDVLPFEPEVLESGDLIEVGYSSWQYISSSKKALGKTVREKDAKQHGDTKQERQTITQQLITKKECTYAYATFVQLYGGSKSVPPPLAKTQTVQHDRTHPYSFSITLAALQCTAPCVRCCCWLPGAALLVEPPPP